MSRDKLREEIVNEIEKYYSPAFGDRHDDIQNIADAILSKFDAVIEEILPKKEKFTRKNHFEDSHYLYKTGRNDFRSQIKKNWEERKK